MSLRQVFLRLPVSFLPKIPSPERAVMNDGSMKVRRSEEDAKMDINTYLSANDRFQIQTCTSFFITKYIIEDIEDQEAPFNCL